MLLILRFFLNFILISIAETKFLLQKNHEREIYKRSTIFLILN